ncbi:PREDICTED: sorting and assembly machinery component 50 homolog A-like [Priapulus caudatus]|uniref:Sorting and assembly machinery component 50 homolog A-like n=1 Tax=Priapulus caudatus TaxID=37621 RepID=A0ABM1DTR2_PRICU|nr:PREDICTED: sorting and assembly machinery component 50 homolog A-like [Priapulus caudatus]
MGAVHAKEIKGDDLIDSNVISVRVNDVSVTVERIHIDGLGRTKNDAVVPEVKQIFQAKKFEDVILKSLEAKSKLEDVGAFKKIQIVIDTSKEGGASDGVEVSFIVEEYSRIGGGIHTSVGNNEGSVVTGVRLPNLLGRGEKLVGEYTYGSRKTQGFNLVFMKPFLRNPGARFTAGIGKSGGEWPWSSYMESDLGASTDLSFQSVFGLYHTLKWEGVWRQIRCLNNTASFAVRQEAGHSLKSALHHAVVYDTRDHPILPNEGFMLRLNKELAGIGHWRDVNFWKGDIEFQLNKSLLFGTVLQGTLATGMMQSLDREHGPRICDRYFLGGPLTLRGFQMRGAGPSSDGDALGSTSYCAGGLHLYTPLPFRPGKGGFGDLFRTHLFINAASPDPFKAGHGAEETMQHLAAQLRWAYGAGIVLCLGNIARLELNYCIPVAFQPTDKLNRGFQFGIGLNFL